RGCCDKILAGAGSASIELFRCQTSDLLSLAMTIIDAGQKEQVSNENKAASAAALVTCTLLRTCQPVQGLSPPLSCSDTPGHGIESSPRRIPCSRNRRAWGPRTACPNKTLPIS